MPAEKFHWRFIPVESNVGFIHHRFVSLASSRRRNSTYTRSPLASWRSTRCRNSSCRSVAAGDAFLVSLFRCTNTRSPLIRPPLVAVYPRPISIASPEWPQVTDRQGLIIPNNTVVTFSLRFEMAAVVALRHSTGNRTPKPRNRSYRLHV